MVESMVEVQDYAVTHRAILEWGTPQTGRTLTRLFGTKGARGDGSPGGGAYRRFLDWLPLLP